MADETMFLRCPLMSEEHAGDGSGLRQHVCSAVRGDAGTRSVEKGPICQPGDSVGGPWDSACRGVRSTLTLPIACSSNRSIVFWLLSQ